MGAVQGPDQNTATAVLTLGQEPIEVTLKRGRGADSKGLQTPASTAVDNPNLEKFCQAVRERAAAAGLDEAQREQLEKFLSLKGQGGWPSLVKRLFKPEPFDIGDGQKLTFSEFCEGANTTPEKLIPIASAGRLSLVTEKNEWNRVRRALKDVSHDDPRVAPVLEALPVPSPVTPVSSDSSTRVESKGGAAPAEKVVPPAAAPAPAPDLQQDPIAEATARLDKSVEAALKSNLHARPWIDRHRLEVLKRDAVHIEAAAKLMEDKVELWAKAQALDPSVTHGHKPIWDQIANISDAESLELARKSVAVRQLALDIISEERRTGLINQQKIDGYIDDILRSPANFVAEWNPFHEKRLGIWKQAKDLPKQDRTSLRAALLEADGMERLAEIERKVSEKLTGASKGAPEQTTPAESLSSNDSGQNPDAGAGGGRPPAAPPVATGGEQPDEGDGPETRPKDGSTPAESDVRAAGASGVEQVEENSAGDQPPPGPSEASAGAKREGEVVNPEAPAPVVELPQWLMDIQATKQSTEIGKDLGVQGVTLQVTEQGEVILSYSGNTQKGAPAIEVKVDSKALSVYASLAEATEGLLLKVKPDTNAHAVDNDFVRHLTLRPEFLIKKFSLETAEAGLGLNLRCAPGAELSLKLTDAMLKVTGESIQFKQLAVDGSSTLDLKCAKARIEQYDLGRDVVGMGSWTGSTFVTGKSQADLVEMDLKDISVEGEFAKNWHGTRFDFDKVPAALFNKKTTKECTDYADQKQAQNIKAFDRLVSKPENVARLLRGVSGINPQLDLTGSLDDETLRDVANVLGKAKSDFVLLGCQLPALSAEERVARTLLALPAAGQSGVSQEIDAGNIRALGLVTEGEPPVVTKLVEVSGLRGDHTSERGFQYTLAKFAEFLEAPAEERKKRLQSEEIELAAVRKRRQEQAAADEEAQRAAAAAGAASASTTTPAENPTPAEPARVSGLPGIVRVEPPKDDQPAA